MAERRCSRADLVLPRSPGSRRGTVALLGFRIIKPRVRPPPSTFNERSCAPRLADQTRSPSEWLRLVARCNLTLRPPFGSSSAAWRLQIRLQTDRRHAALRQGFRSGLFFPRCFCAAHSRRAPSDAHPRLRSTSNRPITAAAAHQLEPSSSLQSSPSPSHEIALLPRENARAWLGEPRPPPGGCAVRGGVAHCRPQRADGEPPDPHRRGSAPTGLVCGQCSSGKTGRHVGVSGSASSAYGTAAETHLFPPFQPSEREREVA